MLICKMEEIVSTSRGANSAVACESACSVRGKQGNFEPDDF